MDTEQAADAGRWADLPEHVGGLISFVASSLQDATAIIEQGPFVREDLIEQRWLKEWKA